MSDIAIKVEGLSKLYKIGKLQRRHDTLRDRIADARLFNLFKRRNGVNGRPPTSDLRPLTSDLRPLTPDLCSLWALKDVSFEVKRGEVVGIIGRNGAGKSTLLKILSRITEPTEGYADINGRVASLLEVGTGFHPELTGRENIYLNGSILGMKRVEIVKKFDEIVAFAEIEKFIDTPVKHYSSGMYVRLAFAVAAHLETEILLVDEVLAVGDVAFQKKCLGKMGNVAREGRTVLFVSHNMQVISNLCEEGILLRDGAIKAKGAIQHVTQEYLAESNAEAMGTVDFTTPNVRRVGTGSSRFLELELIGSRGVLTPSFQVGESFEIRFKCEISELMASQFYQIRIRSAVGTPIYHWVDFDDGFRTMANPGLDAVSVKLERMQLYPGRYVISLMVSDRYGTAYDYIEDAATFDVTEGSMASLSRQYFPHLGIIHDVPKWERDTLAHGLIES